MSASSDPRHYPAHPLIGVSAFIAEKGSVLLVKRARPPLVWSLPGGLVEVGETLEAAARREVREETGLEVAVERFVRPVDVIRHDATGRVERHYVLAVFTARVTGGILAAGDDAAEAEWVPGPAVAGRELTPGTAAIIAELFDNG